MKNNILFFCIMSMTISNGLCAQDEENQQPDRLGQQSSHFVISASNNSGTTEPLLLPAHKRIMSSAEKVGLAAFVLTSMSLAAYVGLQ